MMTTVERQRREFAHSVLSLSSESNLRGHNNYSNGISLIFHRTCNFTFAYNQTWCHSCFFFCSTTVKQRREKINKQNAVNMIVKAYSWYVNLSVVLVHSALEQCKERKRSFYAYQELFSRGQVWHIETDALCDFYITISCSFSAK